MSKSFTCSDAILALLHASGPQERQDLRRECREQAIPYDPVIFAQAVDDLIAAGHIVLSDPDEDPFFDLPASYYQSPVERLLAAQHPTR